MINYTYKNTGIRPAKRHIRFLCDISPLLIEMIV